MSYDHADYRHHQYDLPQPPQPFHTPIGQVPDDHNRYSQWGRQPWQQYQQPPGYPQQFDHPGSQQLPDLAFNAGDQFVPYKRATHQRVQQPPTGWRPPPLPPYGQPPYAHAAAQGPLQIHTPDNQFQRAAVTYGPHGGFSNHAEHHPPTNMVSDWYSQSNTFTQPGYQSRQTTCWEADPPNGHPLYAAAQHQHPDLNLPPYGYGSAPTPDRDPYATCHAATPPLGLKIFVHHAHHGDFKQLHSPVYGQPPPPDPYYQSDEYQQQPPSTVAVCEQEMPRISEGQTLNPTATTLEHFLATLARFETRLDELVGRVATVHQPTQPAPDPPQPEFQPLHYTTSGQTEPPLPCYTVAGQPYGDQLLQNRYPHHMQSGRQPSEGETNLSEMRCKELVAGKYVIEKEENDASKNVVDGNLELDGLADEKMVILEEKGSVEGKVRKLEIHINELRIAVSKLEGSKVAYVDKIRSLESQVGENTCKLEKPYVEREEVERCFVESVMNHTMEILTKRGPTCTFDPGGDTSPKFLLLMFFMVTWFPP